MTDKPPTNEAEGEEPQDEEVDDEKEKKKKKKGEKKKKGPNKALVKEMQLRLQQMKQEEERLKQAEEEKQRALEEAENKRLEKVLMSVLPWFGCPLCSKKVYHISLDRYSTVYLNKSVPLWHQRRQKRDQNDWLRPHPSV